MEPESERPKAPHEHSFDEWLALQGTTREAYERHMAFVRALTPEQKLQRVASMGRMIRLLREAVRRDTPLH